MKKIEMSKNLWYVKFYMLFYEKSKYELPKQTCDLRRALLLPLLLFPFYAPAYFITLLIKKISKNEILLNGKVMFMLMLLSIFFYIMLEKLFILSLPIKMILSYVFGSLFIILILTVALALIYCIMLPIIKIKEYLDEIKYENVEISNINKKPNKFKQLYNFLKEKFCSQIEWID